MPKYMKQPQQAYELVLDAINDDVERQKKHGNKNQVLGHFTDFVDTAEDTIRNVRDKWRKSATERVGQLGLQATTDIMAANENGQIIPPFTDGEVAVLGMKRAMFAGLAEMANPRESVQQTPTQAIETDSAKS